MDWLFIGVKICKINEESKELTPYFTHNVHII